MLVWNWSCRWESSRDECITIYVIRISIFYYCDVVWDHNRKGPLIEHNNCWINWKLNLMNFSTNYCWIIPIKFEVLISRLDTNSMLLISPPYIPIPALKVYLGIRASLSSTDGREGRCVSPFNFKSLPTVNGHLISSLIWEYKFNKYVCK